jgi:hypothetical protein
MTKTHLCERILINFAHIESIRPEDINGSHIYMSSSLAIAMEYLGMLTQSEMIYSRYRGGSIELLVHCGIIDEEAASGFETTREFLNSLPDD